MPNLLGKLLRGVRADQRRSRLSGISVAAGGGIQVSSPAFTDGGTIPTRHAGKGLGDNISPALDWTGAPANTAQLVVAIEDVPVEEANAIKAQFAAAVPLSRMDRPDEIASAALFLASDDSSFVAGAELSVDGGMAQV